jgi:4-aminobutyrate aminotransferase-like enzyme
MHLPVLSTGLGLAGIEVVGAAGVWFRLADGRRVIDASNSAAPLGHSHPDLVAVVRGASGSPALNEGLVWRGRQQAADDLLEHVLSGEQDWVGAVRFCTSVSEANDLALSLAQALTGRSPLVTRECAYLGAIGLAREVTVQPQWHGGLSSGRGDDRRVPRLADVRQIPAPSCGVDAPCGPDGGCRCLPADLADTLGDAAAVIIDYSQGGIQPAPAYQDQLARAARSAGALWIADEAVTGLGRQGRWLTLQRGQTRPDIVTLGKGLAGGVTPAAAVLVSQRVAEMMRDQRWHSFSAFRGHPLTMAAISATVRRIARDGLVERADALGAVLRRRLAELAAAHVCVRRVAGLGLQWIVELRGGVWRASPAGADGPARAAPILTAALDAGVLIAADVDEASLFLAPPLIVSDGELDTILVALDRALTAADRILLPDTGRLVAPRFLPGIDLLAQGAKRGGVLHQLAKHEGQELRDNPCEARLRDQAAVGVKQLFGVCQGNGLGQWQHPQLAQDETELVPGGDASVERVRVGEDRGRLCVCLVGEEVQGVLDHGRDREVVLGHGEQIAVGGGHVR